MVSGKEGNTVYCIFTTLPVNLCSISLLFHSLARASPLPAFLVCCQSSPDSSSNAKPAFANTLLVVLVDFFLFPFLFFSSFFF